MRRRCDQEPVHCARQTLGIEMRFRIIGAGLLLGTVLTAGSASAYDAYDQQNCNGVGWDDKRALVVSKVIAKPRVNFIKSPYDDDFKAANCPADTEAVPEEGLSCHRRRGADRQDARRVHLRFVPVATGEKADLDDRLAAAVTALVPVNADAGRRRRRDWIGTWSHPGGDIEIKKSRGRKAERRRRDGRSDGA